MTSQSEFTRSSLGYLSPSAQAGLFALPRRCEFVIAEAGLTPKRILDVGCASGYISLLLMKLGHDVTGIELNAQMAADARSRGVEVLEHNLELPLPIRDESVDLVHACEIIEHLFDTESFLQELHRILVPQGVLIMSTPNLNSLENRIRVLLGLPLPMWGAFPADRHGSHVRVFNKTKAIQLLERTGFRSSKILGINQPRWSTWFTDRLPTFSELLLIKAIRI